MVAYRLIGEPEFSISGPEFPVFRVRRLGLLSFDRRRSITAALANWLARSSCGHSFQAIDQRAPHMAIVDSAASLLEAPCTRGLRGAS